MEIKFRGSYDKNLFFKSVQLANQSARRKPWVLPVISVVVLVAFIILIFRLVNSRDVIGNSSYIVIVMIAGGFSVRSYLLPYLAARKLWANPAVQEEHAGSISSKGIIYYLKKGKNEMPWERFNRVRRIKGITTLVTRDGLLLIFPRNFFASEIDWQRFNQLVETKTITIN